jgi:ribonuclease P protein component
VVFILNGGIMKKRDRIKNKIEFDNFIKNSKSVKNPFFVIHFGNKKENHTRFGIAVGTKLGNAVVRNKFKRQIREIINEEKSLFQNDKDYIIILRKPSLDLNYKEMKEKLIELING